MIDAMAMAGFEEIDAIIEQFLEGEPRAQDWRTWREVLEQKREHLLALKQRGIEEVPDLEEYLKQLDGHIAALREQEIITEFIEQQIKAVIGKAKLEMELGELQE